MAFGQGVATPAGWRPYCSTKLPIPESRSKRYGAVRADLRVRPHTEWRSKIFVAAGFSLRRTGESLCHQKVGGKIFGWSQLGISGSHTWVGTYKVRTSLRAIWRQALAAAAARNRARRPGPSKACLPGAAHSQGPPAGQQSQQPFSRISSYHLASTRRISWRSTSRSRRAAARSIKPPK
jgi:hypothetical protein